MENGMMKMAKNMAIGMAVGTAITAAGAIYINENKAQAKKAMKKVKEGKHLITKAGESIIREINN